MFVIGLSGLASSPWSEVHPTSSADPFTYHSRCSYWTWWINRSAHFRRTWGWFISPDRPSHSGVRPLPNASACTFPTFLATHHSNRIWLRPLSSGNRRQGVREHLPSCPSSMGSAGCLSFRPVPITLRHQLAPALMRLQERYPQREVQVAQNGSRRATTPDGQAEMGTAALWPRCDEPAQLSHVGRSDSLVQ